MTIHEAIVIKSGVEDTPKKDGTGTYKNYVLVYKSGNEEKKKTVFLNHLQQNMPDLHKRLISLTPGQKIFVHLTGQFYNLTNVFLEGEALPESATIAKPRNSYMASTSRASYKEDDPNRQASIIRQSCLKVAAELSHKLPESLKERKEHLKKFKDLVLELEIFVKEAGAVKIPITKIGTPDATPLVSESTDDDPF